MGVSVIVGVNVMVGDGRDVCVGGGDSSVDVGGVVMAHSITSYQDGEEYTIITFSEVKFNTGLEDTLFEME